MSEGIVEQIYKFSIESFNNKKNLMSVKLTLLASGYEMARLRGELH